MGTYQLKSVETDDTLDTLVQFSTRGYTVHLVLEGIKYTLYSRVYSTPVLEVIQYTCTRGYSVHLYSRVYSTPVLECIQYTLYSRVYSKPVLEGVQYTCTRGYTVHLV